MEDLQAPRSNTSHTFSFRNGRTYRRVSKITFSADGTLVERLNGPWVDVTDEPAAGETISWLEIDGKQVSPDSL